MERARARVLDKRAACLCVCVLDFSHFAQTALRQNGVRLPGAMEKRKTAGVRLLPFKLEPLVSKPDVQQVAPLWRLENSAYADTFKILLSFRARARARARVHGLSLLYPRAPCTIILYCSAAVVVALKLSAALETPAEEFLLRKGFSIGMNASRNSRAHLSPENVIWTFNNCRSCERNLVPGSASFPACAPRKILRASFSNDIALSSGANFHALFFFRIFILHRNRSSCGRAACSCLRSINCAVINRVLCKTVVLKFHRMSICYELCFSACRDFYCSLIWRMLPSL